MRCPYCAQTDTQVKDSRPTEDNAAVRRRRVCSACGGRFTTFERVQLRELIVVKNDGTQEVFEREKLFRSIDVALRKRPVEKDRVDLMVNGIVRQLENMGENEILASHIGDVVMDALKEADHIAYIRFASVYRDFTEVSDFQAVLDEVEEAYNRPSTTLKNDDV